MENLEVLRGHIFKYKKKACMQWKRERENVGEQNAAEKTDGKSWRTWVAGSCSKIWLHSWTSWGLAVLICITCCKITWDLSRKTPIPFGLAQAEILWFSTNRILTFCKIAFFKYKKKWEHTFSPLFYTLEYFKRQDFQIQLGML